MELAAGPRHGLGLLVGERGGEESREDRTMTRTNVITIIWALESFFFHLEKNPHYLLNFYENSFFFSEL